METWINGYMRLDRELTPKEQKTFAEMFPNAFDFDFKLNRIRVDGNDTIAFDDYCGRYPDEEVSYVQEFVEAMGVKIIEGTVDYTGDYDGTLRFEGAEWIDYYAIPLPNIPTEALEKELNYRRGKR